MTETMEVVIFGLFVFSVVMAGYCFGWQASARVSRKDHETNQPKPAQVMEYSVVGLTNTGETHRWIYQFADNALKELEYLRKPSGIWMSAGIQCRVKAGPWKDVPVPDSNKKCEQTL